MRRRFAERIRPLVLTIFLLAACTTTETPRLARTSIDVESETTSPASSGSTGNERQMLGLSVVNDVAQGSASKTERAVGYLALVAGAAALTILAIAFYKLVKILSG